MNRTIQLLMAALVIVMSLVLAGVLQFSDLLYDNVYGTKRLILKLMLVGYAIFRSVRLWNILKQEREDETNRNF